MHFSGMTSLVPHDSPWGTAWLHSQHLTEQDSAWSQENAQFTPMTETPQCPCGVDGFLYFQLLQVIAGYGDEVFPRKATLLFARWGLLSSSCVTSQRHLRKKILWPIWGLKLAAETTTKVASLESFHVLNAWWFIYSSCPGSGSLKCAWGKYPPRWWRGPASLRVPVMEYSSWQGTSLGGSHHNLSPASGPQAYCFLEQGRTWAETKAKHWASSEQMQELKKKNGRGREVKEYGQGTVRRLEETQGILSYLPCAKVQTALTTLPDKCLSSLVFRSKTASLYPVCSNLFQVFTVLRELSLMSTLNLPCCSVSPLFLGHTEGIISFLFISAFN